MDIQFPVPAQLGKHDSTCHLGALKEERQCQTAPSPHNMTSKKRTKKKGKRLKVLLNK